MNSIGPKSAQASPLQAEARPRARPPCRLCRKSPVFLNNLKRVLALFSWVADTCRKVPALPFLHSLKSPTANDAGPRSGKLSPADLLNDRRPTLVETKFKTHRSFPLTQFYYWDSKSSCPRRQRGQWMNMGVLDDPGRSSSIRGVKQH